jgi:hypothetical protein
MLSFGIVILRHRPYGEEYMSRGLPSSTAPFLRKMFSAGFVGQ